MDEIKNARRIEIKYPAASNGVFDPRGIRQMCMQACPLDSLLAGIKKKKKEGLCAYLAAPAPLPFGDIES